MHTDYKKVEINSDELIELKAIEHDLKSRFVEFQFLSNNVPVNLSKCTVRVYALNSKRNEIFNNLKIIDALRGKAQLELKDSFLKFGITRYQLKIYTANGGILSSNIFELNVGEDLMNDNAIESSNEFTALDEALKKATGIENLYRDVEENTNNITKITEKLDYTSERMQDNTETIVYNLKNKEGSYGDCIVIKSDDGTFSMIDCFMEENYEIMIEQLDKIGVTKLKYFFATHDHSDHIGNAPQIIEKYRPQYLVYKDGIDYSRLPSQEREWDTEGYHNRMIAAADRFGVQKIVANDQQLKIGKNDYIEAFASKFYGDYTNLNSFSVNYLLVSHGTKSLFPGDSTTSTETHLQGRIGKVDLYKLSHHGADGGNSDKRFEELQARYCLIDRLEVYKKDIIKNFALKAIKFGGKIFSNDNNDMTVFKISKGAIYPCCLEYIMPFEFLDYYGRYKMTDASGKIATTGIYPNKVDFYFVKEDGFVAQNEWIKFGGYDYHASETGALDRNKFIAGTYHDKTVYYWVNEYGRMAIKPTLIYYNNNTYIIKDNSIMAEEEFYSYQSNWYYASVGGALLKNDWLHKDSNYYWLKFNGVMATNETLFINGKWYDFNGSGVCTNPEGRDRK
ncbi:BppU family phage baseplate upper protein [Clostridium perfringens]|uniref:BppU family phage baseplate upper protein n=1 Tax=Clostridium perfringens TaxID=1502 RepID=UPI0022453DB0|nr:BppU family phage baseplate upper protein [Clostridium perfringens]MCX0353498.1 BppU family phage baseplate upper protein [Clostridium perfringens]